MLALEIVTPERSLLNVSCNSVTLPSHNGQFQVLDGHTAMLAALRTGILSFELNDSTQKLDDLSFGSSDDFRLMVADGFVEVGDDSVRVLCDAAVLPGEVDAASERELISKLEEKLKTIDEGSDKDFHHIEAEIEQAMVKLLLI